MKILITGAHFTPAQAVIEELLTSGPVDQLISESADSRLRGNDGLSIVYVGRKSTREGDKTPSIESQVLPKMGVKFVPIIAGRVRRYISVGTVVSLFKIPIGFIHAFFILLKEKPDVVVSFGGYVAVPVVFNAWLLNIPIIIHEQTLVSGLANTFSALFADKIAVSFNEKYTFNKDKILVTGNPMRKHIVNPVVKGSKEIEEMISVSEKSKKPLILITGGNQGAHSVNLLIEEALPELLKKYIVVHQTGDSSFKDYERLKQDSGQAGMTHMYLPMKWISEDDMGRLYQKIDLAISRCGVNTLLELAFHQVPTIMIPLASVTKDEQTKNAKYFVAKGLGKMLIQKGLSVKKLLEEIEEIISDKKFKMTAKAAKDVVILDAEKKLAQEILLLEYKV